MAFCTRLARGNISKTFLQFSSCNYVMKSYRMACLRWWADCLQVCSAAQQLVPWWAELTVSDIVSSPVLSSKRLFSKVDSQAYFLRSFSRLWSRVFSLIQMIQQTVLCFSESLHHG